jgi:hypothetical protein
MRAGTLGGRSGGGEDEHPLQVPHHGHEAPLDAHFVETAQRKLAEFERRLDDAEHRLRRLLAQSLEVAAFGRLQPMGHGLDPRRIFRGPLLRETLAKRGMMRLAARHHQMCGERGFRGALESSNGCSRCSRASRTCGRGRSRADPFRRTNGAGLMHAPGGLFSAMRRARFTDRLLWPAKTKSADWFPARGKRLT